MARTRVKRSIHTHTHTLTTAQLNALDIFFRCRRRRRIERLRRQFYLYE